MAPLEPETDYYISSEYNTNGTAKMYEFYDEYFNYIKDKECIDVNVYQLLKFNIDDKTSHIEVRAIFGLIYTSIFLVGIIGNGGVMGAVARNRKLQSARNIFLLSLMASDLLLCLTAVVVTPFAAIKKEWIFGHFLCKLVPLSQSMSVLITSWTLTTIALDKFIHIRDVTKGPITLRRALLIIICIWIASCAVNIPYMLSYELIDGSAYVQNETIEKPFCGQFCDEIGWHSDMHRMIYGTSILALQFVVPMVIISFCYIRILAIVRRDMIVENAKFAQSLTAKQRIAAVRRKRRVNYILIAMVGAFIAAWFPLNLVNILRDFAGLPMFILNQRYLWALVVHSVAMTTVIWNPVLFYWLTRKKKTKSLRSAQKSLVDTTVSYGNPMNFILDKIRKVCATESPSLVQVTRTDINVNSSRYVENSSDAQSSPQPFVAQPWRQTDPAPSPVWEPKVILNKTRRSLHISNGSAAEIDTIRQRDHSQITLY